MRFLFGNRQDNAGLWLLCGQRFPAMDIRSSRAFSFGLEVVPCNIELATRNMQHATYNMQHATRNTIPCSMQHNTHVTCDIPVNIPVAQTQLRCHAIVAPMCLRYHETFAGKVPSQTGLSTQINNGEFCASPLRATAKGLVAILCVLLRAKDLCKSHTCRKVRSEMKLPS